MPRRWRPRRPRVPWTSPPSSHSYFFPRASSSRRSRVPLPRSHAAALATPPSRRKASVHSELPWTSRTLDAWARGRFLLPTKAAPQTWRLMQACRPAPARALGPATAATPRLRRGTATTRASYATRFSPRLRRGALPSLPASADCIAYRGPHRLCRCNGNSKHSAFRD